MEKRPYIIAIVTAALLSIVVWLITPITYTARTTVSDEYREMDLSIGLNVINAQIRDITGGANTGMNDMETYCKMLKTESFAQLVANIKVPNKGITYGEYLGKEDTLECILDNIEYNYSSRKTSLTIAFTDKNPRIASQMLDSITKLIQEKVTDYRRFIVKSGVQNANKSLQEAKEKYDKAENEYVSFADGNKRLISIQAIEEENYEEEEEDDAEDEENYENDDDNKHSI